MAQATATYEHYVTDFRALRAEAAGEPDWLVALRESAMARFQEIGLPAARKANEPWKYTNIAPIAGTEFRLAEPADVSAERLRELVPTHEDWATVVLVNGRVSSELSSQLPDGLVVSDLSEAAVRYDDIVQAHLGRQAGPEDDGFFALNTAFARHGAFVYAPGGKVIERPLHLVHVTAGGGAPIVSYPRTLVVCEPTSEVTLIETYAGYGEAPYLSDAVTEIVLDEGAQLDHYRLLLDSRSAYHIGMTRVRQERDSRFGSLAYSTGSLLGRNDFRVLLDAPGAETDLRGLYVTSGSQHIDNFLNIDHAKPHGTSRLYYKGILDEKSKAVFGGTVFVRPGADKTDSHQEDKNLLLSHDAEVSSKPALEIYADDVKAGHGATAGAVADDALFYMRSRGLDAETAMEFLVKGFAAEILDTVRVEPLREYLQELTLRSLPRFSRNGN